MNSVRVRGLIKSYGGLPILDGLDLDVPAGSILSVLGPSGCGKTTLLRVIAGFLRPDAGDVTIGNRTVVDSQTFVASQRRGVGYVPQEGALFPHLTVSQNVLFGLPRPARTRLRRAELLDLAELPTELADRFPHELSGGQQQRVALARALAPGPAVVLLDEPFSSLDTDLRASTGHAVTRTLRHARTTAVLVTHDQDEALMLGDLVGIMQAGRFAQVDTPEAIYRHPATAEIGCSIGGGALLGAEIDGALAVTELGSLEVQGAAAHGSAQVLVRPEQLTLHSHGHTNGDGPWAEVIRSDFHGAFALVLLMLPSGAELVARVSNTAMPQAGTRVGVVVRGPVSGFTIPT